MFDFIKKLFKADYSNYQKINEKADSNYFINLHQVLNENIIVYGLSEDEVIKHASEYLIQNHPDILNAFPQSENEGGQEESLREALSILVEKVERN